MEWKWLPSSGHPKILDFGNISVFVQHWILLTELTLFCFFLYCTALFECVAIVVFAHLVTTCRCVCYGLTVMCMQKSAWSRSCHAMMEELWDLAGCRDRNISTLNLACTISMYPALILHIAVQLEISMSWLKERMVRTRPSGSAKASQSARFITSECHTTLIVLFSIAKKPWEFYYLENLYTTSPELLEAAHV